MINNDEKLKKISYMVMEEANTIKNEIIAQADKKYEKTVEEKEIEFLEDAYLRIQKACQRIEKECNQQVSNAVILNKQALLNRREELVETLFFNVKVKLSHFKKEGNYDAYLKSLLLEGLSNAGAGEIYVLADSDDIPLIEGFRHELDMCFKLLESEEELLGGYRIQNKTKGLMYDYSFKGSLDDERASFPEKYDLPIKEI